MEKYIIAALKNRQNPNDIGKNEERKETILREQNSHIQMGKVEQRTILLPVLVFAQI